MPISDFLLPFSMNLLAVAMAATAAKKIENYAMGDKESK
jgi:hypothetical protein